MAIPFNNSVYHISGVLELGLYAKLYDNLSRWQKWVEMVRYQADFEVLPVTIWWQNIRDFHIKWMFYFDLAKGENKVPHLLGPRTTEICIQSPPKESNTFAEYSKLRGARWKLGGAPNPLLSWFGPTQGWVWCTPYLSSSSPQFWVLGFATSVYFLSVETVLYIGKKAGIFWQVEICILVYYFVK